MKLTLPSSASLIIKLVCAQYELAIYNLKLVVVTEYALVKWMSDGSAMLC